MTQTTPSHSQSVEAKVDEFMRAIDELAELETDATLKADETDKHNPDYMAADAKHVEARNKLKDALRAALTSQQEVAAPVKLPEPDTTWYGGPGNDRVKFHSTDQICEFANARVRAALAASRVPVASLASCEQGVEAVGAVPVEWDGKLNDTLQRSLNALYLECAPEIVNSLTHTVRESFRAVCTDRATLQHMLKGALEKLPIEEGGTAPPSSKTQDDLAGAESGGLQDRECGPIQPKRDREADRKRFPGADFNRWLDESITENGEFSVWDLIPNVACAWNGWTNREHYSAMPQLASQPKAPAPVPVVQGEAVPDLFTQGVNAAAAMLDKMADDFANEHSSQDPDTGVYEFGRGGKEDHYNTLRELADDIRSIVLGNPAPEQATTTDSRDTAWTMAIAEALGLSSGFSVPLTPDKALFTELFQKVRSEQATTGSGDSGSVHLGSGECGNVPIVWPQEKRVGRREDMSPDGVLVVGLDNDNDVYIEVSGNRHGEWQSACVEFCNGGGGGGQSSRTRAALINLMTAIEADNAALPHKAFPPAAILSTASPAGEGEVKL